MREIVDGAVSEAGQHVCEVFADGYAEPAAALDHGEDGGDFWACLFTAQVQPVLPSDGDSPDILPMSVKN
jgi:hypothetical protein